MHVSCKNVKFTTVFFKTLQPSPKTRFLRSYLSASKPPNIGEPIKNAMTTAVPSTTPTTMKRLFMKWASFYSDKNQMTTDLD